MVEAPARDLSPSRLAALRQRSVLSLMAGVALGSTGHIAAVTVATIVAKDLAGTTVWSGAPGATVVLGAALGATLLSRLMVATGRRTGLTVGYVIARPPRPAWGPGSSSRSRGSPSASWARAWS
jgi:hypothetical protein